MIKRFIKKQKNPLNGKMEEVGVVTLTEDQAKTLNASKKATGIEYVLDKTK